MKNASDQRMFIFLEKTKQKAEGSANEY